MLTTPLIAELARRGPVDVVAAPAGAAVLANHPAIRRLFVYDKRSSDAGARGLWRVTRAIRAHAATPHGARDGGRVAYLAQGSARSAMLAVLAGASQRVGFTDAPGRVMYTRRVVRRAHQHHVERLWRLAFPGDPDVEPPPGALRPRLYPGDTDIAAVDALLAGWALGSGVFIALAPGSVWGTKRWPYYPELARRLAPRAPMVVIGSRDDAALAAEIAAATPAGRVLDATGRLSLLGSAELIRRATFLVTNDSAPQHLASAMNTRTLTLYGPTVPAFGFGPLAPGSATHEHPALSCRPCHHHGPARCPLDHWRCMRELDAEGVARVVQGWYEA
ncbi:MAG TPA: glycosyltransferase family 9 protein [Gemmatimonadaceae bacterium]|nr:glycosyltransferase family 9 protein [Gemmatimonadaceae bacterium]